MKEVSSCPRQCHEPKYCTWSDWQPWGACQATCGQGKRVRRRNLGVSTVPAAPPPPLTELQNKYAELKHHASNIEAHRAQEMLAAFTYGLLSFIVLFAGIRVCSTVKRTWIDDSVRLRSAQSNGLGSEHMPAYHHIRELNSTDLPLVGNA